jgi:hypothetical protein
VSRAAALLALLLASLPARAADVGRAHQVVTMIYDISLYDSELDRIMDQADSRGVYGGAGSTPFSRARDKSLTHVTMLSQREAVLSLATQKLAARATDQQLGALIDLAGGIKPLDQSQLDAAVTNVKASFEEAMWDQLARTARGNTMFPCTKDQRSRC